MSSDKLDIIIGADAKIPLALVDLEKLKRLLTIVSEDSGFGQSVVTLYKVQGDYVYVPRYYALKIFAKHPRANFIRQVSYGRKCSDFPAFNGELRPVQQVHMENAIHGIMDENNMGGIVNFGVGTGKTIFALYIASKLRLKTLVIVHKEFLVDQWIERILGDGKSGHAFLPGARVGRIQQAQCEVDNKHIVIGMVHSLAMKEYPSSIYKEFGFVICDETHRMAAPMFSLALPRFNAAYRCGLSATVERKDKTENVFKYQIGPIVASHHIENLSPKIKRVYSSDVAINKDIPMGRLMTILGANLNRNKIIVMQIYNAVIAGRKILVMSHRLKQLKILEDLLKSLMHINKVQNKYSVGYYIGEMSKAQLKANESKDIILSTIQMTKEGLDIPALDTLILATPSSDILQGIGRILRAHDGKKEPVVVDIVDRNTGVCVGMFKKRMQLYMAKGWINE